MDGYHSTTCGLAWSASLITFSKPESQKVAAKQDENHDAHEAMSDTMRPAPAIDNPTICLTTRCAAWPFQSRYSRTSHYGRLRDLHRTLSKGGALFVFWHWWILESDKHRVLSPYFSYVTIYGYKYFNFGYCYLTCHRDNRKCLLKLRLFHRRVVKPLQSLD